MVHSTAVKVGHPNPAVEGGGICRVRTTDMGVGVLPAWFLRAVNFEPPVRLSILLVDFTHAMKVSRRHSGLRGIRPIPYTKPRNSKATQRYLADALNVAGSGWWQSGGRCVEGSRKNGLMVEGLEG